MQNANGLIFNDNKYSNVRYYIVSHLNIDYNIMHQWYAL